MRYFSDHRRRLMKELHNIGTLKTLYTEGNAITLSGSIGLDIKGIRIKGNTIDDVSTGDGGIKIKVSCVNLIDKEELHLVSNQAYYKNVSSNVTLEPNTTYTFSFEYEFVSKDDSSIRTELYYGDTYPVTRISGFLFPNYDKGTVKCTFTTKSSLGANDKLWIRLPASDVKQTSELYARCFMLVKGSSIYDYEPYIEPTIIELPDKEVIDGIFTVPIELKGGNSCDEIVLGDKRVMYYSYDTEGNLTSYNLTNTELGKGLLKIPTIAGTSCVSVESSVPPSYFEITYYSETEEDNYTLKVSYQNVDGAKIAQDKEFLVRKGSKYTVVAPYIRGYISLNHNEEGYMDSNKEVILVYKEEA